MSMSVSYRVKPHGGAWSGPENATVTVPEDGTLANALVEKLGLLPGDELFFPDAHPDHARCVVTSYGIARR